MSKNIAEDNVTMNEQMMEVLSVAWKELPAMMGNEWGEMKHKILSGIANMEGMDDPDDDYLVNMLSEMFKDHEEVMFMLQDITYEVTGQFRPEFEPVVEEEEPDEELEEFVEIIDEERSTEDDENYYLARLLCDQS